MYDEEPWKANRDSVGKHRDEPVDPAIMLSRAMWALGRLQLDSYAQFFERERVITLVRLIFTGVIGLAAALLGWRLTRSMQGPALLTSLLLWHWAIEVRQLNRRRRFLEHLRHADRESWSAVVAIQAEQ